MVTIRALTPSDVDVVFAHGSQEPAFCFEKPGFWKKERLVDWFSSDADVCIGAFEGGELVGFALAAVHRPTRKAVWENVYVIPDRRGSGIAVQLEKELVTLLSEKGVEHVQLMADSKRPELHEFYARLGYKNAGDFAWYSKKFA